MLKNIFRRLMPKCKDDPPSEYPASFGGLPMRPEHFQRITDQLQGDFSCRKTDNVIDRAGCLPSTWSGSDNFYDLFLHNQGSQNRDAKFSRLIYSNLPFSRSRESAKYYYRVGVS